MELENYFRRAVILFGLFFWMTAVSANTDHTTNETLLQKEHDWLKFASHLVQEAQSAQSDAVLFNKDVRESRARLRNTIQQSRHQKLATKHRELHSIMVVMDVLLKSAAACQTGGHIVCPVMLMTQLKKVLKNAYTKLDEVKQSSGNLNSGKS